MKRVLLLCAVLLGAVSVLSTLPAPAAHAAANEVLILGSTVTGGSGSIEASEVAAKGYTPVVVDDATWQGLSQSQFSSYRALILGDPTCGDIAPAAAVSNVATWGSAVNGNVVIIGSDPVYHDSQGGDAMTRRGVDFAVDQAGKTGAYIALSCYYHDTAAHTPVPLLDALRPGGFTVTGVGCYNDAHIVATHPALAGLTDSQISNWSCSVHEGFDTWPADYTVLAMARDYGASFTASDGSVGTPYILASGAGLRSFPLSLSPVSGSAPASGTHVVTAQLLDSATAAPAPGIAINFAVTAGPNKGATGSCNTGPACLTAADGTVSWTYASNGQAGDDSLQAFLDRNGNGVADSGEPQTTAGMHWTAAAVPNVYVALGDSFQSGEGSYSYEPSTNTAADECHRSLVAYPYLLLGSSGVPATLRDVACSGAHIAQLTVGMDTEPGQFDALKADTALVTVGVSGNDVNFASTIQACATGNLHSLNQTCNGRFDASTNALIAKLDTKNATSGLTPLQQVYKTIRDKAPHARIVVVGYPHFFKPSGNFFGCQLIWRSDEKWIDAKIDQLDSVIQRNAQSMGAEYAVSSSAFDGHELCGDGTEYLNGIILQGLSPASESFHPKPEGQQRFADLIKGEMAAHKSAISLTIKPGQTLTQTVAVAPGKATASFVSTWPGSDVVMQLTAPDGRVITRDTTASDVQHLLGPTTELYTVTNPQAGNWTVQLFGAAVQTDGEPVTVDVDQEAPANQLPVGVVTATSNAAGTTVTYSAAGSYDPDGSIVGYEWDFGDHTAATGATVTHTYSNLGQVDLPTLIVTDNQGALGFASAPPVKVTYGFTGWQPPIANGKATSAQAGQALPFKWQLTDPFGKPVTDLSVVTGYAFDQSGATFQLAFTDGQYVLVGKTPKAWAGTTRTFTLSLNDNSTHTATISFK